MRLRITDHRALLRYTGQARPRTPRPCFGGTHTHIRRPTARLDPAQHGASVQAWAKGLPLAPSTVHVVHGIVSAVFRAAQRDRLIYDNPCAGTKLPRKTRARVVPLPIEAVDGLAATVPPQY